VLLTLFTVPVHVADAVPERGALSVTPNPGVVEPGGSIRFSARGAGGAEVTWSVLPGDLGSVSRGGVFVAGPREGKGVIRAVAGQGAKTWVGHAMVRVQKARERFRLQITPEAVVLGPGESQIFRCQAIGSSDDEAVPAVSWKVIPEALGTIAVDGRFRAGQNPARGRVIAVLQDGPKRLIADARVTVRGERTSSSISVSLNPRVCRIAAGGRQQFSLEVRGQTHPSGRLAVRYWIEPEGLGRITEDGLFIAGEREGTGYVGVEVKTADGSGTTRSPVFVEIKREAGLARIRIAPRRAVVRPGESRQFEVAVTDERGQPSSARFVLRVVPERMGTVTPGGLFTAGQQPLDGRLIARLESGETAVAQISVEAGKKLQIRITPAKLVLRPNGGAVRFRASVQDQQGNLLALPVTWRVVPEGLGSITPDGVFTPSGGVGGGAVLAEVPSELGRARARASVVVANYRVNIEGPDPRQVEEGASVYFHARATDQGGKTLNLPLEWRAEPATLGQIDPQSGLFRAGVVPGSARTVEGRVVVTLPADQGGGLDQVRVIVSRRSR
jgi:hypothetical protein